MFDPIDRLCFFGGFSTASSTMFYLLFVFEHLGILSTPGRLYIYIESHVHPGYGPTIHNPKHPSTSSMKF